MNGDFLGGGIVLAVAAILWMVYLVPTLWRKHNFDATQRNAVRLNQTLRALVETSEAPSELRLELTARTVAAQRRNLRRAQSAHRRAAMTSEPRVVSRRARERRRIAVFLLVSLGVSGWGTYVFATSGQWGFVAGGGVGVISAFMLLRNSATGRRVAPRVESVQPTLTRRIPRTQSVESGWKPASIPEPLTSRAGSLARSTVDASLAAEQLRRQAAIDAVAALDTHPPVSRAVTRDRLSGMGIVGDTGEVEFDVSDVVRRRRTGS